VSAIARRLDLDRKTVRKYIKRGLEPPVYGPRAPRPTKVEPYVPFLADRIRAFPGLSGQRLHREIRGLGYDGGYTAVKDALRDLRPPPVTGLPMRYASCR
jgi:transposase